ncbi:MAG: hypothetical protein SVT52_06905 [Planctomycetota bacterium]|nr:hypothetical protein [Planctomycetota bacterium]
MPENDFNTGDEAQVTPSGFDFASTDEPVDDLLLEPQSLSPLNRNNLILVVLFAVGIGCVYLLSLRSGPAEASAWQQQAELDVQNAITAWSQADLDTPKTTEQLVKKFYYEAKQRQIPLSELNGNPFVFKLPVAACRPIGKPEPVEPKETIEQRKLSEALQAARRLKLQSVLTGSAGATAMISNNLLTKGQMIDGWTISEIRPQQVTLRWNEHMYVLKISQ